MDLEDSLSCSQDPETGLYPEPVYPMYTLAKDFKIHLMHLSFHVSFGIQCDVLPLGFPNEICYTFLISPVHED
jgi:hypothetical protein